MLRITSLLQLFLIFLPLTIAVFDIGGESLTPFYFLSPLVIICFFVKHIKLGSNERRIALAGLLIIFLSLGGGFRLISALHFSFYLLTAIVVLSMITKIKNRIIRINTIIILLIGWDIILSLLFYNLGINNDITKLLFGYIIDKRGVRFLGLTSEPSYLAFVISICMLCIIELRDIMGGKNVKYIYVFYTLTIILSRTSFGLLLFFVVSIYAYQKGIFCKRKLNKTAVAIYGTMILTMLLFTMKDNVFFERLVSVIGVLSGPGSIEAIMDDLNQTDSSAAFRLLPTFLYLSTMNLLDFHTWTGFGFGADGDFFPFFIFGKPTEIEVLRLGFFPAAIYNFGLIGASVFLFSIIKGMKSLSWAFYVIFALALLNCNITTQLFWFLIIELYWVSYTKNALAS